MNASQTCQRAENPFKFSTPEGEALCRQILADLLPFEPHDVQIEGVCKILDGVDLFAILPTGMGKTSFLYMYILVIQAIQKDPSLCSTAKFPANPCLLAICPTKYLQHQMADVMKTFTIQSLVINRDTIHEAQTRSEDIWDTAANGPSIIFLAPEQLINPEFSNLIKEDGEFAGRVCAIAVDEAHLLNTWGKRWRKCFQQIGWVRARFSRVTMIAMTATMRRGKHMDSVCEFLGFHEGKFHLIRRSNARPDIQILFRKMKGIGGKKFPELDWVMEGKRKTFILCRTIHLGNRVNDYLRSLGGGNPNLNKRIRMYNAVNWPDFNAETRRWMEEEDTCQIIIGTDTLSVGVNITCAEDVIILGQVEDIDELVQKLGRVGRDKERVTNPRGIIYLPKDVEASARRIVEFENGDLGKLKKGDTMELSMAQMIIADCKPVEQNRQYDNPVEDRPCSCSTCRSRARSNPAPSCSCSGCRPEDQFEDQAPSKSSKRKNPEIPRLKRLSGPMRRLGTEKLTDYRMEIWEGADEVQAGLLPPIIFLPDSDIKLILDNFALLTSTNAISTHLKHNKYICDRLQHTLDVVQLLDRGFEPIRKENKDKAKAAREKAKAKKLAQQEGEKGVQGGDIRSVESEEGSGSEETGGGSDIEEDRDEQEDAMIDQPPSVQRTGFTMSEASTSAVGATIEPQNFYQTRAGRRTTHPDRTL